MKSFLSLLFLLLLLLSLLLLSLFNLKTFSLRGVRKEVEETVKKFPNYKETKFSLELLCNALQL